MNEVRCNSENRGCTAFDETPSVRFAQVGADNRTWGAGPVGTDADAVSLKTVVAGILNGARPFQFMDAIDVVSQQLGNRSFLRLVEQLRADGQQREAHEITPRPLRQWQNLPGLCLGTQCLPARLHDPLLPLVAPAACIHPGQSRRQLPQTAGSDR